MTRAHIMLDLETLSTANNAAIASIGAVMLDEHCTQIEREFYCRIDPVSAQKTGGHVDAGTFQWWLKQSDAARAEISTTTNRQSLPAALRQFADWAGGHERLFVWGNGASFDNVILRSAYQSCGLEPPWHWAHDRCYRTVAAMFPHMAKPAPEVAHHALHDARAQAVHLIDIFRSVRGAA